MRTFISIIIINLFLLFIKLINDNFYSFSINLDLLKLSTFYLGFFSYFFQNLIIIIAYMINSKRNLSLLFLGEKKEFDKIKFLSAEKMILNNKYLVFQEDYQLFNKKKISEVVLLNNYLTKETENYCNEITSKGTKIFSLIEWFEINFNRIPSDLLSMYDFYTSKYLKISKNYFQLRLKRVGDILFSLFLIFITFPLVFVIIFLIKIEDNGPILYSQMRSGFKGKAFKLWKFRSMKVDSELDGPQWAKENDSRITKVGNFMRRTRLDELPQLINVFYGDMSLIGPRPERPEIDEKLYEEIQMYSSRYKMRPGLSGWAQVNYPYGASVEDAKIKLSYDIFYMKNFSFWLDLLIFFETLKLILNTKGSLPNQPFKI